jgi:hypothetical protein
VVFVVVLSWLPAFASLVAAPARATAAASPTASTAWFLVGVGLCGGGGCVTLDLRGAGFVIKSV